VLFAFSKGSISPEVASVGRSVDGLVMVCWAACKACWALAGRGAVYLAADLVARETDYWRALLGGVILLLVLLFPGGVAGHLRRRPRQEEGA
jgi:ABC-type branched-subunit amino acid transport system permease subunit